FELAMIARRATLYDGARPYMMTRGVAWSTYGPAKHCPHIPSDHRIGRAGRRGGGPEAGHRGVRPGLAPGEPAFLRPGLPRPRLEGPARALPSAGRACARRRRA